MATRIKEISKENNIVDSVDSYKSSELEQTIIIMNKINEGIEDIKAGRIMSIEEATDKLL